MKGKLLTIILFLIFMLPVGMADNSDDPSYPPGKAQDVLDFTYAGGIYPKSVIRISLCRTTQRNPNDRFGFNTLTHRNHGASEKRTRLADVMVRWWCCSFFIPYYIVCHCKFPQKSVFLHRKHLLVGVWLIGTFTLIISKRTRFVLTVLHTIMYYLHYCT